MQCQQLSSQRTRAAYILYYKVELCQKIHLLKIFSIFIWMLISQLTLQHRLLEKNSICGSCLDWNTITGRNTINGSSMRIPWKAAS
jgi:hypothetical protein